MTKTCMMNYVGTNDNNVHPLSKSSVTHSVYHILSIQILFCLFIQIVLGSGCKKEKEKEKQSTYKHKAPFDPTGLAPLLNLSTDTDRFRMPQQEPTSVRLGEACGSITAPVTTNLGTRVLRFQQEVVEMCGPCQRYGTLIFLTGTHGMCVKNGAIWMGDALPSENFPRDFTWNFILVWSFSTTQY